jgi:glucokinase
MREEATVTRLTGRLFAGIEIGGTKLQIGLGSGDGKLITLSRSPIERERGAQGILHRIEDELCRLLPHHGDKVEAIGIGFGGPVDSGALRVRRSHQIAGWDDFDFGRWCRERLGCSCIALANDADVAALGEATLGAGRGYDPLLYVTIGSGIGAGLIHRGEIYTGTGIAALELGHLRLGPSPPIATDPERIATLEGIASGWSIGRSGRAAAHDQIQRGEPGPLAQLAGMEPSRVDARIVAEAAAAGDGDAQGILSFARDALARGLAIAVTLLAPRRIILGGGVSLMGDALWYEPVRKLCDAWVFPPLRGSFDIVSPLLGEEVVVHGAITLARRESCTLDP